MQTNISLTEACFIDLFDSVPYKYVRSLIEGVEPDEYAETLFEVSITPALSSRPAYLMQFITFTLERFSDGHYAECAVSTDKLKKEFTVEIEYTASGNIAELMTEIEERWREENPDAPMN